jgi:hypothetical protein
LMVPCMGRLPDCSRALRMFARGRHFERITTRCARRGKGEFAAFGRLKAVLWRERAPFSARSARDKLMARE